MYQCLVSIKNKTQDTYKRKYIFQHSIFYSVYVQQTSSEIKGYVQ